MKIKYINSEREIHFQIEKYKNHYDEIFIITQNNIVQASCIVKELAKDYNTYQCSNSENCKSIDEYQKLIKYLNANGCNKNSAVIAIGGGTVIDLCGFVASTYMRGISYTAIPTTLLAMVDAAIGGKTALNFQGIRNLIGLYNNPDTIIIFDQFITSLSQNDLING